MSHEQVIKGRIFHAGELIEGCIGIDEGIITAVKKILDGDQVVDYGSKMILPAGIDPHVHFRDPGHTHKEDFGSGTLSALYGGVTCVLDMPNTNPPTIDVEHFDSKLETASRKAHCDFGLWGGLVDGIDQGQLLGRTKWAKAYLASTTGNLLINDLATIEKALPKLKQAGGVLAMHCEDMEIMKALSRPGRPRNLVEHDTLRPNSSEAVCIQRMAMRNRSPAMHICHVSSSLGLNAVDASMTCEVAPHHLFLNSSTKIGPLGKMNPPLRSPDDQTALVNALANGSIQMLGSDHAPHTLEEKTGADVDFASAPAGVPGVETMLPLVLTLVKKGQLGLDRFVQASSTNTARRFGLNKGELAKGRDADLLVMNLRNKTKIEARHLHSRCDWTPYEGMEAFFPESVYIHGELAIDNGEAMVDPGHGRFIG